MHGSLVPSTACARFKQIARAAAPVIPVAKAAAARPLEPVTAEPGHASMSWIIAPAERNQNPAKPCGLL
jgi:hypothetical protein